MSLLPVAGASLDPVCADSVLRQGDHRRDPARRGPQRPRVVRGGGAAGLHAGCPVYVPSGQRLWTVQVRGSLQHQVFPVELGEKRSHCGKHWMWIPV